MFKLQKEYIKFIAIIFFVFSLIILAVSLKNNDIYKLSKVSKKIISINNDLNGAASNNNIDYENTCKILSKSIISLQNVDSELNSLNSNDKKFNSLKKSLINYNKLNINLYNSALSILNNNDSSKFSQLHNDLINNEKAVLKSSSDLSNSELDIYFPKSANNFFVSLNKYINDLYKENREKDIAASQKLDFLLNMNNVLSKFSTLKEDLKPALDKIREDNRNLSILLDDINQKRSDFAKIKDDAHSISIPANAHDCYDTLEDMLNSYDIYLNSLEKSVQNEIDVSQSKDKNQSKFSFFNNDDDVNSSYEDSFDKYDSFLNYYDNFKSAIDNYKNN